MKEGNKNGGNQASGAEGKRTRAKPSADGPANKKRRMRGERASVKPGHELVARAKSIWGAFRSKRMDKDERERMAAELFDLIHGKLHQLAAKHDAARVVQCALKHGSPPQRQAYMAELLPHVIEFSKVQYAHFIVLRMFDVSATSRDDRAKVMHVFKGKVLALATHAVGAKVLDALFSTYPKDETRVLRSELYGREVGLLLAGAEGVDKDLKGVLKALPERADKTLDHMADLIQRLLVKDAVTLPFVQELIWEYVCSCGPERVHKLVPTLLDYVLLLTGTRSGCKVLSECAAYSSAKDRKRVLKALKGYVVPTLLHKDAYLLVLRLADVMDDTVSFSKAVWGELLAKDQDADGAILLQAATHHKAHKVLLDLLCPAKRNSFLTKDELELLGEAKLPKHVLQKEASGGDETEGQAEGGAAEEEWVPTSKKDPSVRREELLTPLRDTLLKLVKDQAAPLLRSQEGSFVLFEVVKKWRDADVLAAVAQAVAGGGAGDDMDQEQHGHDEDDGKGEGGAAALEESTHLWEDRIAVKTIKRLLYLEATPAPAEGQQLEPLFARSLYDCCSDRVTEWLGTIRGGFVIEALAKVPGVGQQVLAAVRTHRPEIDKLAETLKGAAAVRDMLSAEVEGKTEKQSRKQRKARGEAAL